MNKHEDKYISNAPTKMRIINKLRKKFYDKIDDEDFDNPECEIAYLLGVIDSVDSINIVFH